MYQRFLTAYPALEGAVIHSAGRRYHDNARCESMWSRIPVLKQNIADETTLYDAGVLVS